MGLLQYLIQPEELTVSLVGTKKQKIIDANAGAIAINLSITICKTDSAAAPAVLSRTVLQMKASKGGKLFDLVAYAFAHNSYDNIY